MKLSDYINDCLKNPEFKKYWEEEDFSFLDETFVDNSSMPIQEADMDKSEFERAKKYMNDYLSKK